jgi:DNA polymerase
MSDIPHDLLLRQLRVHLESLKSAGVEFLPLPVREAEAIREDSAPAEPAPAPARMTSSAREEPRPAVVYGSSPPADARKELAVLAQAITGCQRCPELFSTRTQTVFGVGPVEPDICFVGEAPGADEDKQGEPFVGRAGQLLNKIIENALGYRRDEVYICNTIKCRPPNNRTPSPTERSNCRDYFDRQIELVKPKYIVCLGATAAQNVLGTTLGIGKLRGQVHDYKGIPVVCTYHPSAILREEPAKVLRTACWQDMKLLLSTMGRPIPRR